MNWPEAFALVGGAFCTVLSMVVLAIHNELGSIINSIITRNKKEGE